MTCKLTDDSRSELAGEVNQTSTPATRGELLPCPFCGGEARQRGINPRAPEDWVECTQCKATSDTSSGNSAANWNTRAPATRPDDVGVREAASQPVAWRVNYCGRFMFFEDKPTAEFYAQADNNAEPLYATLSAPTADLAPLAQAIYEGEHDAKSCPWSAQSDEYKKRYYGYARTALSRSVVPVEARETRDAIDRVVMVELKRQSEAGVKYLSGLNVDDLVTALAALQPSSGSGR